ncbi:hypothetical protein M758_8G048100 [Ceratodon purpureus]|uniref:DUF7748 domain-containing protein n=1 Tax=Ceratodon purpureus TaxID=3225 RepID=A0A8T0H3K5_CERPU|nr:hypothetical protein KC19_8G049900 [Ceratodon purpureus]KAG0607693.1 hypothetical protein M758_8G048100 [Ceratodon purpureus]
MWIDTIFENHLDETVELKEGHSGIFTTKEILHKNEIYKHRYDMSATYREFLVVCQVPKPQVVRVTSDDIIENSVFKVVYIVNMQGEKMGWKLDKFKRLHKNDSSDDGRHHHGPSHWLNKMNKLLGKSN